MCFGFICVEWRKSAWKSWIVKIQVRTNNIKKVDKSEAASIARDWALKISLGKLDRLTDQLYFESSSIIIKLKNFVSIKITPTVDKLSIIE